MALRYFRNGPARALAFPLANGTDTSITVDSAAGFPVQFPYTIIIEPDGALEEVCDVTAAVGNVLTITRGVDSTTASAHGAGVAVYHGVSARDPREANAHVNATTNVHGITGSFVDTDSVQNIPGRKIFDDLETTGGGDVVTLGATQTVTGRKLFTDAESLTGGNLLDTGSAQTITGVKTFDDVRTTAGGSVVALAGAQTITGAKTFSGNNIFTGTNSHSNTETFTGAVSIGGNTLTGALTAYTPVRRNGPAGTVLGQGAGSLTGRYKIVADKLCYFEFQLILGAGFAVGTGLDWVITMPFVPFNFRCGGQAFLTQASTGTTFNKSWRCIGASAEMVFMGEAGNRFNNTSPITWANGDEIFGHGWYELP